MFNHDTVRQVAGQPQPALARLGHAWGYAREVLASWAARRRAKREGYADRWLASQKVEPARFAHSVHAEEAGGHGRQRR